ncbi:MAG TPA: hypothetical protein VGO57_12285 [Verrucomicrobiae bacterium]|jgi:hypothetical protein
MKITTCAALGLLALSLAPAWGQNGVATLQLTGQPITLGQPDNTKLTRFNLQFPGGAPQDLVAAIEKATGKSLNVIIPNGTADTQLPPLKMDNITTSQLFSALQAASYKQENRVYHPNIPYAGDAYQTISISYGFKTEGDPSDDSIWYFHVENPPAPPQSTEQPPIKVCRFYQLAPYVNSGLTVDDITTAIQTGWKMMGETSTPEINYHKETKLLIAVGEEKQLQVISDVLKELQQTSPGPDLPRFQQRLQNVINRSQPQPPFSPVASGAPAPTPLPAAQNPPPQPDTKP